MADTFIYNPASQKGSYDAAADSIQITAYVSNSQGATVYYQQSNTGVFVMPELNMTGVGKRTNSTLDKLIMSPVTFASSSLSDFQTMTFLAWYNRSSLFSQDNLRVKFINVSFTVDPFYSVQVYVNSTKAVSKVATKVSQYGETVLDYLQFECSALCKASSRLAIKVIGFRNPSYL